MKHFTRHVDALFSPQSVALVGISEKPSFVGNIIVNIISHFHVFSENLYFVCHRTSYLG